MNVCRQAIGKPHTLWCAFAKFYEKHGDIGNARVIYEKAVQVSSPVEVAVGGLDMLHPPSLHQPMYHDEYIHAMLVIEIFPTGRIAF